MPTREVFAELCDYIKTAVSCVLALGLCWLVFELYVFVAGSLSPVNQTAASVIIMLL